ncbi:hypothetical protein B5X24_HaOG202623 [Helicoverpa armigera]|uniref:Uncharacterized protein n=1 Tax=Helicoverpa armigera TaxID=29058 RepID=A0A2W1BSQ3_HELAM|nr:hypothetical protein B5X24_HaOG202623 [Helicoverpa armigera]
MASLSGQGTPKLTSSVGNLYYDLVISRQSEGVTSDTGNDSQESGGGGVTLHDRRVVVYDARQELDSVRFIDTVYDHILK